MRAGDLMQDPYYARLIFEIEGHVYDYDLRVRKKEGVELRDSDIKSALRKAMGMFKGTALRPPQDQEDRLKGALAIELVAIYEFEAKKGSVSRAEFVNALLAAEDSLKLRRKMGGHSRGYLDFLAEFVPGARGDKPEE